MVIHLKIVKDFAAKLLGKSVNIWADTYKLNSALNIPPHPKAPNKKSLRMEVTKIVEPPAHVRGMKELDKSAFSKTIDVPCLRVPSKEANVVIPLVKNNLLKMEKLRPVRVVNSFVEDSDSSKEILLNPQSVKTWSSLPTEQLVKLGVTDRDFYYSPLELNYDNWRVDEIFKNVLPSEQEGLTSYSRIGHIVHLNLREHLLPYKKLIGHVLLDKVAGCRTVVNKTAMIHNTYRNFQLELICGEPDYHAAVKENGTTYEFDFSLVYWNPRLCTEHQRIVDLLNPGDVVYDVFAGVGPFSVPAAKKRCSVIANDLNPESFRWLEHNAKRNKCLMQMQLVNKDGRDFIAEDIKSDLLKRWANTTASYNTHIVMNLPAIAIEFIDAFCGLLRKEAVDNEIKFPALDRLPTVHVYCFARGGFMVTEAYALIEENLKVPLRKLDAVTFVRNVAPNKDMYRISFRLTEDILTGKGEDVNNRKRCASPSHSDNTQQSPSLKLRCT